jgi:hypothetical protein
MPGWARWLSYSESKRAQTPPLAVDALALDARTPKAPTLGSDPDVGFVRAGGREAAANDIAV